MSDTRRDVQPGWGPDHPRWPQRFGYLSPKSQARDRKSRSYRNHRFNKNSRNTLPNLTLKVEAMELREALEDFPVKEITFAEQLAQVNARYGVCPLHGEGCLRVPRECWPEEIRALIPEKPLPLAPMDLERAREVARKYSGE